MGSLLIRAWSDRWIPGVVNGKLHTDHVSFSEFDPFAKLCDLID